MVRKIHLEPLMLHHVSNDNSLDWVYLVYKTPQKYPVKGQHSPMPMQYMYLQHLGEEIHSRGRQMGRDVELTRLDLLE